MRERMITSLHNSNPSTYQYQEIVSGKKLARFEQQFDFYHMPKEDLFIQKVERFLRKFRLERRTLKTNTIEIARDFSFSPRTVEFYLKNIKDKIKLLKKHKYFLYFPTHARRR